MRHKYTKEEVSQFISESTSIRQVLSKLGIKEAGGNYSTMRKFIQKHGIDTSHFTGHGWSKGRTIGPKRPIEDYLSNKQTINSHSLREKLIRENVVEHKCQSCNQTEWMNKKIPLELHHIDGDRDNNNLSNLQILCPNCHALTDNYRGRKPKIKSRVHRKANNVCKCGQRILDNSINCTTCFHIKDRKVERPAKDDLITLIQQKGYLQVGKMFGVSDNAVRKWIKYYGLEPKSIKKVPSTGFAPA